MLFDVLLTIFLVLLNGFFVAAEFAIVKVRASQLEVEAKEGKKLAGLARNIVEHLDEYLSATQLGITLASLGLGWIGESVVSEIIIDAMQRLHLQEDHDTAHKLAFPIAFAIITILHIVFGELAPKSLAIQRPQSTSMAVAIPLRIFYFVFKPFIWILNGMANLTLRAIGVPPAAGHDAHSPEELLYIIEQSKTGGTLEHTEHSILENVLDFYNRPVKSIMRPRTQITAIELGEGKDAALDHILETGYSRIPVYEDTIDNVVGVLYSKDLLKDKAVGNAHLPITQLLRSVYFVPETKKLGFLLRDLQAKKVHMAIVIDEFGGTAGLVTLEDVIEELVGEIQDEYDDERPLVTQLKPNEYEVLGSAPIIDANEVLPVPLPEGEDYETVGGYVTYQLGYIPEAGARVTTDDYNILVLKQQDNHISLLRFSVVGEPDKDVVVSEV